MKKVFSILIVAAALVAVSCVGNANKATDQVEEVEVVAVVDSLVCDQKCCDDTTCCAEGQECKGGEACAEKKAE